VTPIRVGLWIDPGCPWAWQTAVWLRELAADGRLELDWRIFSLELNAMPPETPFWEACQRDGEALVALALARREGGNPAFERLYESIGSRLHVEKQEPTPDVVRAGAEDAGMPGIVDRAVAVSDLTEEITQESVDARARSVFGVPTLQIGDAKVLYGPIMALAPRGDEAHRMWEHTRWLAERDDFFELKRWPRDIRPGQTAPRTEA
jgi:predicted DsbA family dithiol-disulfide isomerase